MSSTNRPRRPFLDRDEPDRAFSGAFGARQEEPPEPNSATEGPEADVARGVGTGYRLIEEYLKRGQEVAQAMWSNAPAMPGMPPVGFPARPERLLEYSTQVVSLWFEMVRKAWPAPAPPTPGEPPAGFEFVTAPASAPAESTPNAAAPHAPAPGTAAGAPVITLALASAQPVEVTVELKPECRGKELVAFDLRPAHGDAERIAGVELAWVAPERVRLALTLPETQPPGTYVGVVVDAATSLPLGTISAVVRAR